MQLYNCKLACPWVFLVGDSAMIWSGLAYQPVVRWSRVIIVSVQEGERWHKSGGRACFCLIDPIIFFLLVSINHASIWNGLSNLNWHCFLYIMIPYSSRWTYAWLNSCSYIWRCYYEYNYHSERKELWVKCRERTSRLSIMHAHIICFA